VAAFCSDLTGRGEPLQLSNVWTMKKDRRAIQCVLYSHQFGWELRMSLAQTLVRSQVCRSEEEVFTTQEQWKATMQTKGWQ
jgi:hypothetical protein